MPLGLCALSAGNNAVLAVPGQKAGTVHIEVLDGPKHSHIIPAHTNPLTQIVLNVDGTRLATASEKGTLVKNDLNFALLNFSYFCFVFV